MDGTREQSGSCTSVAIARHAASPGPLSMSFRAAGIELTGATPVMDSVGAFTTIAASTRRHVSPTNRDTSTTASLGGGVGSAGGYAERLAPSSHSVINASVPSGASIAGDNHPSSGTLSTRVGSAAATTRTVAVESHLTAAQNDERGDKGNITSRSHRGIFRGEATGTATAKVLQRPVTVTTPQPRPTSSTPSESSSCLAMEGSSRGFDQVPQQGQQPVSPGRLSSNALLSTGVPVQHLYRVPSAFYAHNGVTSSAALSIVRDRCDRGNTFTVPAPSYISAEDTAQTHVRRLPGASFSSSDMDALEERARRAAELHASVDVGDETETVLAWAAESRSGKTGRVQVPVPSSLSAVRVARGYRRSRCRSILGSEDGPPLDSGSVSLIPGPKRRRRHEGVGGSVYVQPYQRLSNTSIRDDGGTPAVPTRWLTSPSVSSSSSIVFASPQSPAVALASAATSTSGISASRPRVAPSPFSAVLAFFGAVPSRTAAMTASGTGPFLRTATTPPTEPPAWVRPWVLHTLSRAFAAHLARDVDASVAAAASFTSTPAASSAGTVTQSLHSSLPVAFYASAQATETSASAQPRTLRAALLLIFDGLERLEAGLAEVLVGRPNACHSPDAGHGVKVDDCRASPRVRGRVPRAPSPSSAATAAESDASAGFVEQLRHLTRQWCEVLSQWPCEVVTLGYVEWWLGHAIWTDLVTCAAAARVALSAFPATSEAIAEQETRGREAETSNGGEWQPPQPSPQVPAFALQGILAAAATEGMRTLLDALVDAFVRAVSDLLRSTDAVGQPRSAERSASCRNIQVEIAVAPITKAQHTCMALLRLFTSLYASPPPVLQQLLTLIRGEDCFSSTVTGAAAKGDARATTLHDDADSPTLPGSLSTATAAAVAGEDLRQRPHPPPPPSSSSWLSPRGAPPGSPFASVVNLSALDASQLRSRVCQLQYQLLYAVCRLCNELPMRWQPQDCTRDAEEGESSSVRASSTTYMEFSPALRHQSDCEMARLSLFATAARLAATVSALLLHVQLPMKGDLLCVAGRLAQWRAALLRSSCMNEREYTATMGHLCALMTQAM
ncbi:hypothetical protein NXY56_001605 [Leishmania guyanensis]